MSSGSQSTTIHVPSLSQPVIVPMPPLSAPPNSGSNSISTTSVDDSNFKSSKRGRGGANGISTWGTGERFHIDFDKHGLPIGKCEQPLVGQLGLLARNGFRVQLTYPRWSDLPDDVLDGLWREVQDNTDAPPEFRTKCLHIIGERWREWKHYIKRHNYNIYKTDEERLSIIPDRVVVDQWRTLVQYWGQDTIKSISATNSCNRECQGGYHRMDRSSFRSIRQKDEVNSLY
ncbi:hypothetical protein KSP39_PZI016206 [Platanthera zijinensis]|uniref:Uncharacterized protein n=1 Tax=Platanthera zijinensis TaxID=2320716 RepID=A0AAP0G0V0_9ASPA